MTAEESPAVRRARRCARNPTAYPSLAAKWVAQLLAELDLMRTIADQLNEQVEALNAELIAREPRVWLTDDKLPAGVWVHESVVGGHGSVRYVERSRIAQCYAVEVRVPTSAEFNAAVAAERERRAQEGKP